MITQGIGGCSGRGRSAGFALVRILNTGCHIAGYTGNGILPDHINFLKRHFRHSATLSQPRDLLKLSTNQIQIQPNSYPIFQSTIRSSDWDLECYPGPEYHLRPGLIQELRKSSDGRLGHMLLVVSIRVVKIQHVSTDKFLESGLILLACQCSNVPSTNRR